MDELSGVNSVCVVLADINELMVVIDIAILDALGAKITVLCK